MTGDYGPVLVRLSNETDPAMAKHLTLAAHHLGAPAEQLRAAWESHVANRKDAA